MKYNLEVRNETVFSRLTKITNQVYRLLPLREEDKDWENPLSTIQEELSGFNSLTLSQHDEIIFPLCCKLEGLYSLKEAQFFDKYRSTIFKCISLLGELRKYYE